MRQIEAKAITQAVKELAVAANYDLGEDLLAALTKGEKEEESPAGREIFRQLLENARIASQERFHLYQSSLNRALLPTNPPSQP